MKGFNFQKAIYKYAIILSIEYSLTLLFVYYVQHLIEIQMMENGTSFIENLFIQYIPTIRALIFHIIYAILVYKDFKVNNIKNPLIVTITLFFGFIGIALFFIQLIYNEYKLKPAHNNGEHEEPL